MQFDTPEYKAVSSKLGFVADVHFVTVEEDGSVGFSAGKPEEAAFALQERRSQRNEAFERSEGNRQEALSRTAQKLHCVRQAVLVVLALLLRVFRLRPVD